MRPVGSDHEHARPLSPLGVDNSSHSLWSRSSTDVQPAAAGVDGQLHGGESYARHVVSHAQQLENPVIADCSLLDGAGGSGRSSYVIRTMSPAGSLQPWCQVDVVGRNGSSATPLIQLQPMPGNSTDLQLVRLPSAADAAAQCSSASAQAAEGQSPSRSPASPRKNKVHPSALAAGSSIPAAASSPRQSPQQAATAVSTSPYQRWEVRSSSSSTMNQPLLDVAMRSFKQEVMNLTRISTNGAITLEAELSGLASSSESTSSDVLQHTMLAALSNVPVATIGISSSALAASPSPYSITATTSSCDDGSAQSAKRVKHSPEAEGPPSWQQAADQIVLQVHPRASSHMPGLVCLAALLQQLTGPC